MAITFESRYHQLLIIPLGENTIIGATKCVDTAKDLYPSYIFEKSQGQEHNNLDYQMNLFHLWVP
jgi:hypothetical protein